MQLTHTFTVPAPVADTWTAFTDLEMVAGCFPGAKLTSAEGEEFKGTVKVKLGPIALQYAGAGKFLDQDEDAHRFVIEAKGKDRRGNGTAAATVTVALSEGNPDSTTAEVVTDLSITGKPAQFGRGVIQDVSDKILQDFVACLEGKVAAPAEAAEPEAAAAEEAPPAKKAPAKKAPAKKAAAKKAPAKKPAEKEVPPAEEVAAPAAGAAEAAGGRRVAEAPEPSLSEAPSPAGQPTEERRESDALDLGATVLPILLKAYWRQLAAGVLVLLVLRWLFRRRRS